MIIIPFSDEFLIGCAQGSSDCVKIMSEPCPEEFTTRIHSTAGTFDIVVTKNWAPFMAQRFYTLSRLGYFYDSRFYRVLIDKSNHFVSQFGYSGKVAVDQAWMAYRTDNTTVPVLVSNQRGTVAFGTKYYKQSELTPFCSTPMCSMGYSVELFINLDDNSRLDGPDFAPFGSISVDDMKIVDRLYAGYGECSDICVSSSAAGDPYCYWNNTTQAFQGVNFTRMLAEGNEYLNSSFPLLDIVTQVELFVDTENNLWTPLLFIIGTTLLGGLLLYRVLSTIASSHQKKQQYNQILGEERGGPRKSISAASLGSMASIEAETSRRI
jgi:peptidyl-prolyl cis-trans isomerase A (cyclophilin A)